ncbi:RNF26 ligase, partial [Grantiella picta]|nr:RNF26 ligase [Grantiella picta]
LLRGCSAGMEGLSALALRGWKLARRGLGCGQALGRQLCEALGVCTQLLRDLGKVCLAGTRRLFMLLAALWDSLAGSVLRVTLRVTELLAAFLAYVSSRATSFFIQLWSHCQPAFKLLCSATVIFMSTYFMVCSLAIVLFFIGVCVLVLLFGIAFLIAFVSVLYCNWEWLTRYVLGFCCSLQTVLWWPYQVAMPSLRRAVSSQHWRRPVEWVLRVVSRSRGGRRVNQGRGQLDAGQVPHPRPALSRAGGGQCRQTAREKKGTSWWKSPRKQQLNATAGNAEGTPDNDPWALLKEQEERKKCVICQDQTKTVLLLPCRHLCLCQECTEVLLQQDIDQRNCPLCRETIYETVNVYL